MKSLISRYKKEKFSACKHLLAQSMLVNTSAGLVETALVGNGNAVLISHGSGGGYDMGLWLAHLISGQFQYIAPSRFGYLRSPIPTDSTPEAQSDAYAALLDALKVESVTIIGLSAGGPSALQFALRHPRRCNGLIMISAISRPIPPLPPLLRAIYPLMLKSDFLPWLFYTLAPDKVFLANGVSRSLLSQIKYDHEKMKLLDSLYRTSFPSTLRRDGMLNDVKTLTKFPTYPLEMISIPTLVIHAINDPIVPVISGEFSASTISNAKFLRIEDGGHFACVTHKEKTIPIVHYFLNRYSI